MESPAKKREEIALALGSQMAVDALKFKLMLNNAWRREDYRDWALDGVREEDSEAARKVAQAAKEEELRRQRHLELAANKKAEQERMRRLEEAAEERTRARAEEEAASAREAALHRVEEAMAREARREAAERRASHEKLLDAEERARSEARARAEVTARMARRIEKASPAIYAEASSTPRRNYRQELLHFGRTEL